MKRAQIFYDSTEFLYRIVKEKETELKKQGFSNAHPKQLDLEFNKDQFPDTIWSFLKDHQEKFRFPFMNNFYPIYEIKGDKLFSNEGNVVFIQNNFYDN